MINERDLLWVPNFIVLGINFIFGTKFFWNEGTDTCFTVEYALHGRNFDFLWWLLGDYCPLLVVTARFRSFPRLVWTASSCSSYQNLLWQKFDLSRNTSSKNQSNKNQPHKFPIYWICPTPSVLYQIQQQIHTFSFFNDFKLKNEVIID